MLLPFLSVGAFALAANSFFIPLEVIDDIEISKTLEPLSHQPQKVQLDCSTCPFALNSKRNGIHEWTNDVKSDLEMEFSVEGNKVSLNGKPFYPISFPNIPPALSVKQVQKTDDKESSAKSWEAYNGDLVMSYSLEVDEKHFPKDGADATVIVMTIMGLEGQMINVDNIEIKLLTPDNSKPTITSIKTIPASPDAPDAKCQSIFCRVLNKIKTNIHIAKETAKSATKTATGKAKAITHKVKSCCIRCMQFLRGTPHHSHHHNLKNGGKQRPSLIKPHGGFSNAHAHMNHHHRGWFSTFIAGTKRVFSLILFPILVGIAFGVTASAVGMFVGQLVVLLWMKFRRTGGEVTYERVETDDKEKLPLYEDIEGLEVQVPEKDDEAKY